MPKASEKGKKYPNKLTRPNKPPRPKRSPTAFFIYLNESREKIKKENPEMKVTEISSLALKQWKELSEEDKKEYIEKADDAKNEYLKKLEEYTKEYVKKLEEYTNELEEFIYC